MKSPLLQVENLTVRIDSGKTQVRAVDGVSFSINRHETFALLGESGCGKSMTALSLMRLLPDAGRIVSGAVSLDGQDLLALPEIAMRSVRGERIAMIFQEPMNSLNPVMTVGRQIAETLLRHTGLRGEAVQARVLEMAREPMVWWSLLAAFVFMFVLVLSANLFSDRVRDAFDPRV
ncbi:MAG: ATP-binding cassette domain-containing protein, partial [Gammaproteobacteria bacterium]|nr:ATP-binding cassette domain-containing protein [Gammaproteobacteria bacterium]